MDLLMLANHATAQIRRRGIRVTIKRGQIGYSQEALAGRWRWSKGKVIRFLKELKQDERISIKTELKNIAVSALITILNYEQYQGCETEDGTENGPKTEPKTVPEQECKEGKEKKPSSSGDEAPAVEAVFFLTKKKRKVTGKRLEAFNLFWNAFGYKQGKAEAGDAWLDIPMLTDSLVSRIVAAAKRERALRPDLQAQGRTPKMAQGWLSGRRWEDEDLPDCQTPVKGATATTFSPVTAEESERIKNAIARFGNYE